MVDSVSGPADNVHFGSSPTFCGFTPVNGRKRSLTPIAAIVNAVPTKRLASYASIDSAGASGGDPSYQSTPTSSATATADPKDVVVAPHHTQTTPPLDESLETPQCRLLPLHNVTELGHDDADLSWMEEFVNLDQEGDMSVVPSAKPLTNYPNGDPIASLPSLEGQLSQNQSQAIRNDTPIVEDNYGFDDSDEEEMAQLGKSDTPSRVSPTSQLQDMDRESRPSLSYGLQPRYYTPVQCDQASDNISFEEPDLLDEDVDWSLVAYAAQIAETSGEHSPAKRTTPTSYSASNRTVLARSPFPEKIRDRSPVVGLSSNVLLRICFRVGELLNAHTKCDREKQDVVLELFARVHCSTRDGFGRAQHFQLKDLFTERQPYLSGSCRGWKSGGPVDDQSKIFLGREGKNRLCRCICKLTTDKETPVGRSAQILSIRETTWDEIEYVLRIVTRGEVSEDGEHHELTPSTA